MKRDVERVKWGSMGWEENEVGERDENENEERESEVGRSGEGWRKSEGEG